MQLKNCSQQKLFLKIFTMLLLLLCMKKCLNCLLRKYGTVLTVEQPRDKEPFINDIRKISPIFDPLPP